jgi:hypothetical protein
MAAGGGGVSVVAAAPSPYWYLTRGAGVVAMLLLTTSVVLGILDFSRWRSDRWPRFLTDALHRNVSMLAIVVVALHVVTTLADGFAPIGLKDAFVPFLASYRPLWLGFGALAFDLLLAVAITSMLRGRLGYKAWRGVHWAAYACWPLALVHGLGTGSDATAAWMLLVSAACLGAVLVALAWRVRDATSQGLGRRLATTTLVVGPLGLIVWMAMGPLAGNWAARAGTPASLLVSVGSTSGSSAPAADPPAAFDPPFTADLAGSAREGVSPDTGLATVALRMSMSGGTRGNLDVKLAGQPLGGGGVAMTEGTVSLGPPGQADLYTGKIVALHGSRMVAAATSGNGGSLRLTIDLSIDQGSGAVNGTVRAEDGSGG